MGARALRANLWRIGRHKVVVEPARAREREDEGQRGEAADCRRADERAEGSHVHGVVGGDERTHLTQPHRRLLVFHAVYRHDLAPQLLTDRIGIALLCQHKEVLARDLTEVARHRLGLIDCGKRRETTRRHRERARGAGEHSRGAQRAADAYDA